MKYKERLKSREKELRGWGFDLSPTKLSRADFTNVHPVPSKSKHSLNQMPEVEWCHYAGMPSPAAYMEDEE
jgi:hypothetical protein